MKQKLKSKICNLLFIGGITELLLQLTSLNDNFLFTVIGGLTLPFLIGAVVIVLLKNQDTWINRFTARFAKTSLFLKWIGIVPYFSLPLYFVMLNVNENSVKMDSFILTYGAFLQILEYVLYSLALIAVLMKLIKEHKQTKVNTHKS